MAGEGKIVITAKMYVGPKKGWLSFVKVLAAIIAFLQVTLA